MPIVGPGEVSLNQTQEIIYVAVAVGVCVLVGFVAALLGRRSGRRAIAQRLAALGTRLGLEPPQDEYNVETSLAYLEQVTGGAAQAVTESSSDAIRLRRSLDTLTQGVVLCDENGAVIYRNERANALMVSRHGDALAAQAVTDVLEDAWHEGSSERTLDLYGPPRRTLQVRAHQIDDGRRPLGVIALIEDVSERRRLEEIRRDFVANVSHELKTPMGALGLLAETLVSEPDPLVAQRLAGRIHNEAFRVSRIIDDLLDLSRIESEETPPREPVLVNLVMADAIERVRATADQRGIEIVLHEPSPPVAVMGDRRQLVSAMHALLENAITYSYDDSKVIVTGNVHRANPEPVYVGVALPEPEGSEVFGAVAAASGDAGTATADANTGTGTGDTGTGDTGTGNTGTGDTGTGDTGTGDTGTGDTGTGDTDAATRDAVAGNEAAGTGEEQDTGELPVTATGGPGGHDAGPETAAETEEPETEEPETGKAEEAETEKEHDGEQEEGAVEPVFTPEILEQYTQADETSSAKSPATGTTAPAPGTSEPETAADPTETGGGTPTWRTEESTGRDTVRISVQDHGIGIPARDLDRIFERFYRVDHGRSRDTGGTGLGLSIVRHVANNHQGWVDVESREGEGSTFTLVLPVQAERVA